MVEENESYATDRGVAEIDVGELLITGSAVKYKQRGSKLVIKSVKTDYVLKGENTDKIKLRPLAYTVNNNRSRSKCTYNASLRCEIDP